MQQSHKSPHVNVDIYFPPQKVEITHSHKTGNFTGS